MAENLVVVNAEGPETRVGVVEHGRLAEFFLERKRDRGIVGNIYKAKVKRVLPGMQAAFVDLGPDVDKDAFLYAGDVVGAIGDVRHLFDADPVEDDEPPPRRSRRPPERKRIEDLLKEGQLVLVQVVKDAIAQKGARVTGLVSLPGRYLVFMPMAEVSGVSRRLGSDQERKRLRRLIEGARPKGAGFIARTAAEGASDDEIRDDADFLVKLWKEIGEREKQLTGPGLVYADLDLVLRVVRDRLTEDISAVVIDTEAEYERARKFAMAFMSKWVDRIKRYDGRQPIFDFYGLEAALRAALDKKVPLKSGGSLVIEQGEALTMIDVNTGSFVGKKDLEETITKNNLEACEEIARQLRLRNIGGIIVIDFVDMEKQSNRKKVLDAFLKALEADHSHCNVTKISELGLVEMTRKRTRESLNQLLSDRCPACDGRGTVKSTLTVAYEILREVRRHAPACASDTITVTCAPKVAELLRRQEREWVDRLEKRFHKRIDIAASGALKPDAYKIDAGGAVATSAPDAAAKKPRRGRRGGRSRKKAEQKVAADGA
ncbi:MAG: Rne/Rng family ribonuclease [Deltaproteobacteria bacterium]|nr:MAG: Rne/Rng family ribonuclease [Deltaproteobacteria bacterium]